VRKATKKPKRPRKLVAAAVKAMSRIELENALARLPGATMEEARYIVVGDHELDFGADYCFACADRIAKAVAIAEAVETYVDGSSSESDLSKRCDRCNIALHAGGLTNYGVDSALGLTETNPKRCHTYVAELLDASSSMMKDDPRWEMWEFHARKVLRSGQQI